MDIETYEGYNKALYWHNYAESYWTKLLGYVYSNLIFLSTNTSQNEAKTLTLGKRMKKSLLQASKYISFMLSLHVALFGLMLGQYEFFNHQSKKWTFQGVLSQKIRKG